MVVKFNSVEDVKTFVNVVSKFDGVNFDLSQNHKYVDGKSILGIMSFDLSRNVILDIYGGNSSSALSALRDAGLVIEIQ